MCEGGRSEGRGGATASCGYATIALVFRKLHDGHQCNRLLQGNGNEYFTPAIEVLLCRLAESPMWPCGAEGRSGGAEGRSGGAERRQNLPCGHAVRPTAYASILY